MKEIKREELINYIGKQIIISLEGKQKVANLTNVHPDAIVINEITHCDISNANIKFYAN